MVSTRIANTTAPTTGREMLESAAAIPHSAVRDTGSVALSDQAILAATIIAAKTHATQNNSRVCADWACVAGFVKDEIKTGPLWHNIVIIEADVQPAPQQTLHVPAFTNLEVCGPTTKRCAI